WTRHAFARRARTRPWTAWRCAGGWSPRWSAARSFTARRCRRMASAVLALEDGSHWLGEPFGASVPSEGEVVFNTGMTGYQEIATDASYAGQMVVLTHPQVGNYGVAPSADESERPWLRALIVRELSATHHHWEARESLDAFLRRNGIPGIAGVDTRALVRRLRARGALRAVL